MSYYERIKEILRCIYTTPSKQKKVDFVEVIHVKPSSKAKTLL